MATRWGIAGSGKISADFAMAMKALGNEHKLVAVAARALVNAETFAKTHGAEKAYDSYEELAKDPNIDVVYVGVIHPYHIHVARIMIESGKAVLCEKPLCMNVKETKQLIDLARDKKVFLMEAVWSRFFPVYKMMMKRIQSGEIGDVVQVISSFGQPIEHVNRATKKPLGGGSTLDLGVYCAQFASIVMGGERPLKIVSGGHMNSEVNFPMWCPESLESPSGKFESLLPKTGQSYTFFNSQGLMYEAMEVRDCLQKGLLESPSMPLDETLILAEIMEAMRTQVGVVYPQDN